MPLSVAYCMSKTFRFSSVTISVLLTTYGDTDGLTLTDINHESQRYIKKNRKLTSHVNSNTTWIHIYVSQIIASLIQEKKNALLS